MIIGNLFARDLKKIVNLISTDIIKKLITFNKN